MKKLSKVDWLVLAFVLAWKSVLLFLTAQPLPTGDSFFYDGAVVNYLEGGKYCNPALAEVLHISGTEVFSAYPPLHQAVLWAWMSLTEPSALSALWFHLSLFTVYALGLFAILRQLRLPAYWINLGSLFLFAITFHDRPDTLAFALGIWSIYFWIRAGERPQTAGDRWNWLAAGLNVLTLAASLQIGTFFILWCWLFSAARSPSSSQFGFGVHPLGCSAAQDTLKGGHQTRRQLHLPWLPCAATLLVPALLVLMVRFGYPRLWAGFREHVREAPTFIGWQGLDVFAVTMNCVFKMLRTVPGALAASGLVLLSAINAKQRGGESLKWAEHPFLLSCLAMEILLVAAAFLCRMEGLTVWIAYLQPLLVAAALAALVPLGAIKRTRYIAAFLVLAAVTGIRAVGMSTWGVACARDVSYANAVRQVRLTLDSCAPDSTVLLSGAFLYEGMSHRQLRLLHVDWLASYRKPYNLAERIWSIKPRQLILTQFDYWRRFKPLLDLYQAHPEIVAVRVRNCATVPPPDQIPGLQKVVQHVAWAPVLVEFSWRN